MTGTEKQVAWANEIRNTVIAVCDESIAAASGMGDKADKIISYFSGVKTRISTYDGSAAYMIDVFKLVKDHGPKGTSEIISAVRGLDIEHKFC